MPCRRIRHIHVCLIVASMIATSHGEAARADRKPPTASIAATERHKIAPRSSDEHKVSTSAGASSGWWWSTAGAASILALAGWASFAGRKFLPKTVANTRGVKVVGRTSLSPKHSVYLLQVGERVLIVGTGPQGAPSLLGELNTRDELTKAQPTTAAPTSVNRFDHRLGDDDA